MTSAYLDMPIRSEAEVLYDRAMSRQLRRVTCGDCRHHTDDAAGGFCLILDQPRHGREDRCEDDFKPRAPR